MITFKSLGLVEPVMRGVKSAGYTKPTKIQAAAIPVARERHDLIGCAQTGTGKTAAFVLPMLDRLTRRKSKKGHRFIRSLVVVPTRELALQVTDAIRIYGRHTRLKELSIYGGVDIKRQTKFLRRGLDIVVATPGRLLDHINRGNIDLSKVELLILDEADRMLDMGFIRDIRKIISETPDVRQTMLFSATMPPSVEKLAESILHEPKYIEIGRRRNPAESVVQRMCAVQQAKKMELLVHVLEKESIENVIVFSRTKHRADRITRKLQRSGFRATVLHSNRSQYQRQQALKGLRNGKFQILVATNIASRGIDLEGVSHVINYDTPQQAENYIHRIGRTGRADTSGNAITFVGEGEFQYLRDIEKHTGKRIERLEFEGLTLMESRPKGENKRRPKAKNKRHAKPRRKQANKKFRRNKIKATS